MFELLAHLCDISIWIFYRLIKIQLNSCSGKLKFCMAVFHEVVNSYSLRMVTHLNAVVLTDNIEGDLYQNRKDGNRLLKINDKM